MIEKIKKYVILKIRTEKRGHVMERYEVEDILGEFRFKEYKGEKGTIPYRIHIPDGGAKGAPVVLFMHGAGERGTDNCLQLRAALDVFAKSNPEVATAVVIAPQCPRYENDDLNEEGFWVLSPWGLGNFDTTVVKESWELETVVELLKKEIAELGADADRVYVMGLSMGGFATWDLISRHGELFAADRTGKPNVLLYEGSRFAAASCHRAREVSRIVCPARQSDRIGRLV